MKTLCIVVACLTGSLAGAQAQVAGATASANPSVPSIPTVVNIGPNHRVFQWQTLEPMPTGQMTPHLHQYTELCSGLNYLDASGAWRLSQEKIEAFAGGAVASQGQNAVIFANNLNTTGSIDVQTPDGKRLRSNILGLMYADSTTGQAVVIAQIQDSDGELISDNQVLYPNALGGTGVKADVMLTYRRDGLEQDVILKEQIPAPEAFGMSSATAELVSFTEFLTPPAARVADLDTNTPDAEPDQAISWGATSLGRGRAFILNGKDAPVTVIKRYVQSNGRYFLQERVRFRDIQASLARLPQQSSNVRRMPVMASKHPALPKTPAKKAAARPMRLALTSKPGRGYVLDYITLNASYTNYDFRGDTTYLISGNLNLDGTTLFEGNTVVKFTTNSSITAVAGSAIEFLSQPYRPVIFTAKDDSSVGEAISGATGNPSGYYADPALNLGSMGSVTLDEFRISYANRGLSVSGASPTIYNAQFVNCGMAFSDLNGAVTAENVLFSNIKTNFNATSSANTIFVQNATFNNNFDLINGSFANTSLYLTNCVFVNVTNESGNLRPVTMVFTTRRRWDRRP